jgi:hypothetical protein
LQVAKVYLRRTLVDHGEGAEPRYENKYDKVVGELDELRVDFSPLVLNGGTEREVTVLLERSRGSFPSPLVREADMSESDRLRWGWLRRVDERNAVHTVTGEVVELAGGAG